MVIGNKQSDFKRFNSAIRQRKNFLTKKVCRQVLKFKLVTEGGGGGISTARLLPSQRSEGDREDSIRGS